ncbi:hypothetical protein SRHO_G00239090 [Serrasalmus rhombeus]
MRGLQKSDAGWYWFSAGDVGVTVHLIVTEIPSTTTAVTTVSATEKTSISETTSGSTTVTKNTETTTAELSQKTGLIWVLLPVGLGLLLLLTIIITCMLRKKCNGNQTETRGRVSNTAVHTVSIVVMVLICSCWLKPRCSS